MHWTKFGQISHFDHSRVQQRMNDDKAVYDATSRRWHLYFTYWPTGWGQASQHLVRVTGSNETDFDFEHPEKISVSGMEGPANASGHMSFSQVVMEGGTWHMFAASEDLRYSTSEHSVHAVSADQGASWRCVNSSVMI